MGWRWGQEGREQITSQVTKGDNVAVTGAQLSNRYPPCCLWLRVQYTKICTHLCNSSCIYIITMTTNHCYQTNIPFMLFHTKLPTMTYCFLYRKINFIQDIFTYLYTTDNLFWIITWTSSLFIRIPWQLVSIFFFSLPHSTLLSHILLFFAPFHLSLWSSHPLLRSAPPSTTKRGRRPRNQACQQPYVPHLHNTVWILQCPCCPSVVLLGSSAHPYSSTSSDRLLFCPIHPSCPISNTGIPLHTAVFHMLDSMPNRTPLHSWFQLPCSRHTCCGMVNIQWRQLRSWGRYGPINGQWRGLIELSWTTKGAHLANQLMIEIQDPTLRWNVVSDFWASSSKGHMLRN